MGAVLTSSSLAEVLSSVLAIRRFPDAEDIMLADLQRDVLIHRPEHISQLHRHNNLDTEFHAAGELEHRSDRLVCV